MHFTRVPPDYPAFDERGKAEKRYRQSRGHKYGGVKLGCAEVISSINDQRPQAEIRSDPFADDSTDNAGGCSNSESREQEGKGTFDSQFPENFRFAGREDTHQIY